MSLLGMRIIKHDGGNFATLSFAGPKASLVCFYECVILPTWEVNLTKFGLMIGRAWKYEIDQHLTQQSLQPQGGEGEEE